MASLKNKAITYTQISRPGLAAALVRKLTSKSSSGHGGQHGASQAAAPAAYLGRATHLGEPGERYQPPRPNNGRTGGIAVAQAAAAPAAPKK